MERSAQLCDAAQRNTLDIAIGQLTANGATTDEIIEQITTLAAGIGFDLDEANRLVIGHRRRVAVH